MYIIIQNLFEGESAVNYKGLDIDQFIPHSQAYNVTTGSCVVQTTELIEPKDFKDVTEVSKEEYQNFFAECEELNKTQEQRQIEALAFQNSQMLLTLVEKGIM